MYLTVPYTPVPMEASRQIEQMMIIDIADMANSPCGFRMKRSVA